MIPLPRPTFSIIVPVYNEEKTVGIILDRIFKALDDKEIIVVNDASTDNTLSIVQSKLSQYTGLTVHSHTVNQGKGAAIHTGLKLAQGEFVAIQDADLEYDPKDLKELVAPLIDGRADVVFGSRFLGGPHRVLMYWHYVGNKMLTLLTNILGNVNLSDMETCYKAFKLDAVKDIHLKAKRFGFEPEFTLRVCQKKLRIYESPISYSGRTYAEGKKISWKDGFRAIYCILKYNVFSKK